MLSSLSSTVLYLALLAVCMCRATQTANNGQDDQCKRLHCMSQNNKNASFNCSIDIWAPLNGRLCVQHTYLNHSPCKNAEVDEIKSGITATKFSESRQIFIKLHKEIFCYGNMTVTLNIPCNNNKVGLVYINLKVAPSIRITAITTENNQLHLQCNGTGLHQNTELRLYGPNQEEYPCYGLSQTEGIGAHVVCQHTIVNPNQTHNGQYNCQVDPNTCDALTSNYVHVQVQTNLTTTKITTDITMPHASTVSNTNTIIITVVAGIVLTSLATVISSFILAIHFQRAMKPNRDNERHPQHQPADDRREEDNRGDYDRGQVLPDEPDQEQLSINDEYNEDQPGVQNPIIHNQQLI